MKLDVLSIPTKPDKMVDARSHQIVRRRSSLLERDLSAEVLIPKHLIHNSPNTMDIFIADLDKNGAGIGEQIPCDRETVSEIGEIAVDPVAPRVAKRLDLLRLSCDVVNLPVFYVSAGGGPLEVAVELDAV